MRKDESETIIREMLPYLNNLNLMRLKTILNNLVTTKTEFKSKYDNENLLNKYFAAKRAEGCS